MWCESLFASDRKDRCRVCTGGDCRVREAVEILYSIRDEGDPGCAEHEEHERGAAERAGGGIDTGTIGGVGFRGFAG